MANSMSPFQVSTLNNNNYDNWSIKMKALLGSQDVRDIIEEGYNKPADDDAFATLTPDQKTTLKDSRKRDKKALYLIYQALDDYGFEKISSESSSKEVWEKLQTFCKGSEQVKKEEVEAMEEVEVEVVDEAGITTIIIPTTTMRKEKLNTRAPNKKIEEKANYVEEKTDGKETLLLARKEIDSGQANSWYLDNGPSNHMCRRKDMFIEVDESEKFSKGVKDKRQEPISHSSSFIPMCVDRSSQALLKSEVFKKFKEVVERESGRKIKAMRSNRGGEFTSREFQEFCERRLKIDDKSESFIFIDYDANSKGYKLYNPDNKKIVISRDVVFNEEGEWDFNFHADDLNFLHQFEEDEQTMREQLDEPQQELETPPTLPTSATEKDSSPCHRQVGVKVKELYNVQEALEIFMSQKAGIDYDEVFAHVVRLETIRLIISLAAQNKWKIQQMDVKYAFLNGVLEEEVYIKQSSGYEFKGQEDKVLKLKKALYGLKQYALYIKIKDRDILIMCLYVDDLIFSGSNPSMFNEFKDVMMKEFEMTYMWHMAYYLGIEVKQQKDGIFISQESYAKEILKKFKMENCKPISTPTEYGIKMSKHEEGESVDPTFFKSLVGSLCYLTCMRPDILHTIDWLVVTWNLQQPPILKSQREFFAI
ncbi:hypothetical protein F3Y22_tig00111495pilonHSYRG00094 [Hibiscus syriacus]|uniref:Reverse transcriptase Ty1/copia-type domain-containing protein n=1 Tax=Hibiscus syriacus TaxID=106335 RepID=A0A6A2Y7X3_HIBSY|nr:hypothetical protein F3Y22_tig00111495pilonHSYRG00094 [Hibiscus syriacus]